MHIKSGFILNGVCVLWRGWVDLQRLEGFGCLEFDEYRAYLEEAMLKQQIDKQQACNTGSTMNHHHHSAALAANVAAAAHLSANPLSPFGLNPSTYLGPSPGSVGPPPGSHHPGLTANQTSQQQQQQQQQAPPHPPVSLAESAAHYGNAAIAAAAAAAFHQALSVAGGGIGPPPTSHQALHRLSAGGGPQSVAQDRKIPIGTCTSRL